MVAAQAPEQLIDVLNPVTGERIGTVPDTEPNAVADVAARLRNSQVAWEAMGAKARGQWLHRFRNWMMHASEGITDVLVAESGKVRPDATLEVMAACSLVSYWADHAADFLRDNHPRSASLITATKRLSMIYLPYPLVGVISPWNFPVGLFLMDAAPALAAGCSVLAKPSEATPLTAKLLERGWQQIGAPAVLAVVTGAGATGAALVDQADYIQFTGSTATGRKVALAAASSLKPYSLELGGKDPAIVCADADLNRAVNGIAWGGLFNTGQVCVSVERVYVEAPVYDQFVAGLASKVHSLTQHAGRDVGVMVTDEQLAIVERHVTEAVAAGARALTGGKRGRGESCYEPTVLIDVDHSMACMTEETFGPTIPVMRVADTDEAIRLANDSPYGLSASVWTSDPQRGAEIGRRLQVGAVNVNDAMSNLFAAPLPHSGWKLSGVGARQGGAVGLHKYCRVQAQTAPKGPALRNELNWYPYSARRSALARVTLRAAVGRGVLQRLGL